MWKSSKERTTTPAFISSGLDMKLPKYLKGQRLVFNKEEIVQFVEWKWDGMQDLAWVKALDGEIYPVAPEQLKRLPNKQL